MTPNLQLKLFGSPQISYQGEPLTGFVSTKVRALLIYLAVTARPHSRDHLAHLLWEDTPASMKPNLRKALSNLRQLLGDLLVEEGRDLIALDAQRCWVDVVAFEHSLNSGALTEAAQLYTADFLAGFNPSLSYEFEAWALREQSRLKSGMVDLLRKLATQQTSTALSAGSSHNTLGEAIGIVRRLLDLEPWHEESHRWLMELLAKNGQRSAALAHFEVCKRVLKDELDVAPSAETLQLVAQIQQATLPVHKPAAKVPAIAQPEFPLIGREREWQTIQAVWQHCLHNGPHFVCIAGEAGIGKTRLTEEARIWVTRQGYASAYARSYAAEGALSYSPVVDWLRSEAIRPTLGQLDTVWLNEIARLLPELLTEHPQLLPPKPITDGWQRRQFFEALARAIIISAQPMLLVIDDLQWCDRETLEWLRFLLRFAPKLPLLVVSAYRIEEMDYEHPLQTLLYTLRREGVATEIELNPLSEVDTTTLIHCAAANRVSDEQVSDLWKATTGHPLFVIESLRYEGEHNTQNAIPHKIQSVIQSRLAQLSAKTLVVAELAAVAGRAFTPQLLIQASKQEENSVIPCLDELWQRRIITEHKATQYDFSHDRIRETVYANISPIKRPQLHQQIAEALKTLYKNDLSEWDAQIAVHYQSAGQLTDALHYFVEAVQTLSSRWALAEALTMISRAQLLADHLPETDVNLRYRLKLLTFQYNMTSYIIGRTAPQLRGIAEQILLLSEKLNDHTYNFFARNLLRVYHSLRAERVRVKAIAEENVAFVQAVGDQSLIWEAYTDLGFANFVMGALSDAKSWYDRSNEVKVTFDSQIPPSDRKWLNCVEFYHMTAMCYYLMGYLEQAEQWVVNAFVIAEASNNPHTFAIALEENLCFQFVAYRTDSIRDGAEQLKTISQEHGFAFSNAWSNLFQGWALTIEGHYEQTIHTLKQVIEYFVSNQYFIFHPIRLGMLGEAYRMVHRYAEGITTIQEALAFADRTSDRFWVPELYRLRGELLLGSGAASHEVEESYQKSLEISRQQSSRLIELRTSVSLARLWQQQGKTAAAYQLLAPIYNWFTEGFDTPDLIAARRLVEEVATTVH